MTASDPTTGAPARGTVTAETRQIYIGANRYTLPPDEKPPPGDALHPMACLVEKGPGAVTRPHFHQADNVSRNANLPHSPGIRVGDYCRGGGAGRKTRKQPHAPFPEIPITACSCRPESRATLGSAQLKRAFQRWLP